MVPLQLIGFGWLWLESGNQLTAQFSQVSTELAHLPQRRRLRCRPPQRLLASASPGLLSSLSSGGLPQQKALLNGALDLPLSRLQSNLNPQRTTTLRNAIPATVRVVAGAAIVSAVLLTIRRSLR
ncbi:MAG: hypothetical protein VKO39_01430 [Cyanobacteriota bacterium]|nr:hypothetical protein [Cyanobacteriota bacterium]